LNLLAESTEDIHDALGTTVNAIAQLINEHIASVQKTKARILVTGGGAHNSFLMQQIKRLRGRIFFCI
jgi:1,6-anhydro-N-acetylmuramate kinase